MTEPKPLTEEELDALRRNLERQRDSCRDASTAGNAFLAEPLIKSAEELLRVVAMARLALTTQKRAEEAEARAKELDEQMRSARYRVTNESPVMTGIVTRLRGRWLTAREIATESGVGLNTVRVYLSLLKTRGAVDHRARNVKHAPTEYRALEKP